MLHIFKPSGHRPLHESLNKSELYLFGDNYLNERGQLLKWKAWFPDDKSQCKAIILIITGFKEHLSRYSHIANFYNNHQYAVYCMEHEGHGTSDGVRLCIDNFDYFVNDQYNFINNIVEPSLIDLKLEKLPRFILGHSMGGLITLLLTHQYLNIGINCVWKGVIYSSPLFMNDPGQSNMITRTLLPIVASIFPYIPVTSVNPNELSHCKSVVYEYMHNPLTGLDGRVRAIMANNMVNTMSDASTNITPYYTHPCIIIHGEMDKITCPQGSINFMNNIQSTDKKLELISYGKHELFNELPEIRNKVKNIVLEWMEARL